VIFGVFESYGKDVFDVGMIVESSMSSKNVNFEV